MRFIVSFKLSGESREVGIGGHVTPESAEAAAKVLYPNGTGFTTRPSNAVARTSNFIDAATTEELAKVNKDKIVSG